MNSRYCALIITLITINIAASDDFEVFVAKLDAITNKQSKMYGLYKKAHGIFSTCATRANPEPRCVKASEDINRLMEKTWNTDSEEFAKTVKDNRDIAAYLLTERCIPYIDAIKNLETNLEANNDDMHTKTVAHLLMYQLNQCCAVSTILTTMELPEEHTARLNRFQSIFIKRFDKHE